MKPGLDESMNKSRSSDTPKSPQAFLLRNHEVMSWGSMAKELGYNKGVLSDVANNRRRASDELIKAINRTYGFKFSLNPQPAPVCHRCGVVHVTKKCTANTKLRGPRRNWKRDYQWLASMIFYITRSRTEP